MRKLFEGDIGYRHDSLVVNIKNQPLIRSKSYTDLSLGCNLDRELFAYVGNKVVGIKARFILVIMIKILNRLEK